jgi:hypothetical protein
MNGDAVRLPPDARSRVDAYLDAIEEVLDRSGRPRGQRRAITDEVEAQIMEMLAERAGFAPSVGDVEAVLADLDPPEAYAEEAAGERPAAAAPPAAPSPPPRPRLSRAAIVGVCWAPLALLLVPALLVFLYPAFQETERPAPPHEAAPAPEGVRPREEAVPPASPEGAAPEAAEAGGGRELSTAERWRHEVEGGTANREAALAARRAEAHARERVARGAHLSWAAVIVLAPLALLGLTAPFGTTILGIVAIAHIRHAGGRLYGMGLALFDALLFPLLLLNALFLRMCIIQWGLTATLALMAAADVGIVLLGRWLVRPPAAGGGRQDGPAVRQSRRRLGIVSLVLCVAGLVVGGGTAAVAYVANASSALMVGYLVFLGLEVAALVCGILGWSASLLAKAGAIASGIVVVVSVLFLA